MVGLLFDPLCMCEIMLTYLTGLFLNFIWTSLTLECHMLFNFLLCS